MKHVFYLLSFLFLTLGFSSVSAQDLNAEEVLANVTQTSQAVVDAQFLLTGKLIDADGTEIPLEVDVQIIPGEQVARADFFQPDALADNFVMVDGDAFYNYIFLTNQATVFSTDDPDALGGIFPAAAEGESFDFTFDLNELFSGWTSEVIGYDTLDVGNVYTLNLINLDDGVNIDHVEATVIDGAWLPYTMTFFNEAGDTISELVFNDIVLDSGLNAADVAYLPDDAELIDER